MADSGFLVTDFERFALSVFHDICVGDRFIGIAFQTLPDEAASSTTEQRLERGARVLLALLRSGLAELYREAGEQDRSLDESEAVALIETEYRQGSAMLDAFDTNNWRAWPAFDVLCRPTDEALELFQAGEWQPVRDRIAEADGTGS